MDEKLSPFQAINRALKGYLPIRWRQLFHFSTLRNAITVVPRVIRYATVGLVIVGIGSFVLSGLSLYLALTHIAPASGGAFREAVIGGDLSWFNPLIDRTDPTIGRENNIGEKKVNALLFLPLYTVTYPNYLTDSKNNPVVVPVLLASIPKWQDADNTNPALRYKKLSMNLRSDLHWSDKSLIAVQDIHYSFDRLKESKGNPQFRNVFQNVTFEEGVGNNFFLVSTESNPNLFYQSNFSPVSHSYFEDKNTDGLLIDKRSAKPEVTSGAFNLPPIIDDPETAKSDKVANPQLKNTATIKVILQNSGNLNYQTIFGETPKLEYYVVKRYDRISEGSADQNVLAQAAVDKSVDLFERSYESDLSLQPNRVSNLLKLRQVQVPTNTFLTLYYNIKRGPTGFLINQSLRKYITCQMLAFSNKDIQNFLNEVPKERRILPIQFGDITTIDCGTSPFTTLDSNYTYTIDPNTKNAKVSIASTNQPITLEIVGFVENSIILKALENYFATVVGIPLTIITKDSEIEQRLTDKNYNLALLAHTVLNRDVSEDYSASKRDLSSIPGNDRVTQYKFNENLDAYTLSNGADKVAKQALSDFFSQEIVSVNLYQYQEEYNYSPVVKGFENTIPKITSSFTQLQLASGKWYLQTKRVF